MLRFDKWKSTAVVAMEPYRPAWTVRPLGQGPSSVRDGFISWNYNRSNKAAKGALPYIDEGLKHRHCHCTSPSASRSVTTSTQSGSMLYFVLQLSTAFHNIFDILWQRRRIPESQGWDFYEFLHSNRAFFGRRFAPGYIRRKWFFEPANQEEAHDECRFR